jgi:NagD protein
MGYRTILVLSGGTRREDLAKYAYQPDLIIDSVADLAEDTGLLHQILPTMRREDDTPHDLREWAAAHG